MVSESENSIVGATSPLKTKLISLGPPRAQKNSMRCLQHRSLNPLSGQQSPQGRNSSALGHLGRSKMACAACSTTVSKLERVQNNFSPCHWDSASIKICGHLQLASHRFTVCIRCGLLHYLEANGLSGCHPPPPCL